MRWEAMRPSDQVEAADWIRNRLHPFAAHDVGSTVPQGFGAYARLFHPAWIGHDLEVSWSQVAASTGRTVHPEMQFHAIAAPRPRHSSETPAWQFEPRLRALSRRQIGALIPLLAAHTSSAERCLFCLWEGYGYFNGRRAMAFVQATGEGRLPPPAPVSPLRPRLPARRVRLPARDYVLFTGSVDDAAGWEDGPNLWWPDDRAWCVASEIDFPYTYVGGSSALVGQILDHSGLEALAATIEDSVTADGDRINA